MSLITERQLDAWVRANSREAQGIIVETVARLVEASTPHPTFCRFPLGDSIEQSGPDGELVSEFSFEPFIPEGRSFWEIGTGEDAKRKASRDYIGLTEEISDDIRQESTFVFVSPFSGVKGWKYRRKEDGLAHWLQTHREKREWFNVRVIDGTILVKWVGLFPNVARWLLSKMESGAEHIDTPELRWEALKAIGSPPDLPAELFLADREQAQTLLRQALRGDQLQLQLDTHHSSDIVPFVCAYLARHEDVRLEMPGRCLIVSDPIVWKKLAELSERHILIANFDIDATDSQGSHILQIARRRGHVSIYQGQPGGIPTPNRIHLGAPNIASIERALITAGYKAERARQLSQKSGGNLDFLLYSLSGHSPKPKWSQDNQAAHLAIATLLGEWDENKTADKARVEQISGKSYGEWIELIRQVLQATDTPLVHRDSKWKLSLRYEAWYALGSRIFDSHLVRFKEAAIEVLSERDPQLDLPSEERYMASLYEKERQHSQRLRNGICETLALLGSHPNALNNATLGRPQTTATRVVRELLNNVDWERWAGLNDVLPLLAEAAPEEFLRCTEQALQNETSAFDEVFAQESSDLTGRTYITGLLWALETLAWSTDYLGPASMIFAKLATRDQGGSYANRPINSLITIYLPWMYQTTASFDQRLAILNSIYAEYPEVGWVLLTALLPGSHQVTSGSRKPAWRQFIPDNWSNGVSRLEVHQQCKVLSELVAEIAQSDFGKLDSLLDHPERLTPHVRTILYDFLHADKVEFPSDESKTAFWNKISNLIAKHQKFAEADWAFPQEEIDRLISVAERLKPENALIVYRRLFTHDDHRHYAEKGNFEEQRVRLAERRQEIIEEILAQFGQAAVIDFAETVEAPWKVGAATGLSGDQEIDQLILPGLLNTEDQNLSYFCGGFVEERFRGLGWEWLDSLDFQGWSNKQIGQLYAYLPFQKDTWDRVEKHLGQNKAAYWLRTTAYPYHTDQSLEIAVDELVKHGRPVLAIKCLYVMLIKKQAPEAQAFASALLSEDITEGDFRSLDNHELLEVIKAYQNHPQANPDDLEEVEWRFLYSLNRLENAYPKILETRLATNPDFFCEIIQAVFVPEGQEPGDLSDEQKQYSEMAAKLIHYWRTPPGIQSDGSFSTIELDNWLKEVTKRLNASGHLKIGQVYVGKALKYAPEDPDGLWIHKGAAKVLNDRNAEEIRNGFTNELYNTRGVFTYTGGTEEMKLAEKYNKKANELEKAGFVRFAKTIREFGASYQREAEREASRSPYEDL